MRYVILGLLVVAAAAACLAQLPKPAFTDAERAAIVAYWNAPGRYRLSAPPEAAKSGPWQVRLTPEGSVWFHAYQSAVSGAEKVAPTQDATASTPDTAAWEAWVKAKLAWDRHTARAAADAANLMVGFQPVAKPDDPDANAQPPSVAPPALVAAAGNPPTLSAAVTPMQATVTFDDNEAFTYTDHVNLRPRFAYYRFPNGTAVYGGQNKPTDAELDALFSRGMSPSEARAARAVSKFEGDFEAVNTYDTGYVSIGFIQFITARDGTGSLLEVLQREKKDSPVDFQNDFRRFGIDVDETGTLVVVDPDTGVEISGSAAVQRVIDDKRLTAPWQRAGRHSSAFRIAQVQVAKSHYWPADDPVTVVVNGQTLTGKVSDVVHSEAGLATLFDRKVNRGSIRPFADVVTEVITTHQLKTLADAAAYERDIVQKLKYRGDFLNDPSLGQPPAPPVTPVPPTAPTTPTVVPPANSPAANPTAPIPG